MSMIVRVLNSRCAARLVLAGLTSALLAGCSSDFTRMSDPSSNPFQNSSRVDGYDRTPTATSGPRMASSAPISHVESAPLAAPVQSAPLSAPRYAVPARPSPQAMAAPVRGGAAGWSPEGGTPIVVAQGENLSVLSGRYGIPSDALLRANGLSSASQVQPGTRLTIPVYNSNGVAQAAAGAPVRAAQVAAPHMAAAKAAPSRVIVAGAGAEEAAVRPIEHNARMQLAKGPAPAAARMAEAVKPAAAHHVAEVAKAVASKVAKLQPATKPMKAETVARAEKAETVAKAEAVVAKMKPVRTASLEAPANATRPVSRTDETPTASLPSTSSASATASATSSDAASPEFRWPARGRIIQGFKSGSSDGINIAVPEGTSVKAAEGGVVAYAGSELKGYGNLVLIRHPNGFVSAYAHNGEVSVKRGETVKRGQIIAKSGQSGNVSSPQLHFELRKGSTPVDPTQYLAGL
ncbi:MAG: LysM peptidoglycan-binding protein [Hyphomicrobiales bacterium]|nr:LysM peptidoglycan-binding protein [Hyphomicrobiales bacterium]